MKSDLYLRGEVRDEGPRRPPIYRQVFQLRDVEALSVKETAEELGISVLSVKVRLHRARMMLQKQLSPLLKSVEMRQQALARVMAWDKSRLSHQLTRMQEQAFFERHRIDGKTVLVALTKLGRERLDAARPIHAASVLRNLLSRLTQEQIDTIVRVSNLLGKKANALPFRNRQAQFREDPERLRTVHPLLATDRKDNLRLR